MNPPPTSEELEKAIKKLKNNKAPAADGITAELFKQDGTELKNRMLQLIFRIWTNEELPHEWNFGIICPKSSPILYMPAFRNILKEL